MTAQNKKASMLESVNIESLDTTGLKMVKNASIFSSGGILYIRHYATVIFAYNTETNKAEVLLHCSITSDRQIKTALEFFNVPAEKVTEILNGSKWGFSEARN
jgi:hypothetical protein